MSLARIQVISLISCASFACSETKPSEQCSDGECANEDTSLLSLRQYPQQKGSQQTWEQTNSSQVVCTNSQGLAFLCAKDNTCCGDVCAGPGSTCCHNQYGHGFPCAPENGCCGNSCQAPGSKCCVSKGVDYPVTKDSKCAGWELGSRPCVNRYGVAFYCSKDSSCCGDICAGAGSSCCTNQYGNNFVCAPGSKCDKNICVADTGNTSSGSSTNVVKQNYAYTVPLKGVVPQQEVSQQTSQQSNSSQVVCTNSHGLAFLCAKDNTCCGDICAGPGSICCQNQVGDGFACAPGSACCGNSCQAPGSRCCVGKGVDYPVTKDSKCAGWELGSRPCENRYGVAFYCSKDSSCCGDICGGAGSSCCKNQYGNDFVCAPGSKCGKNVCVADTGNRRRSSSTTFDKQTYAYTVPVDVKQR